MSTLAPGRIHQGKPWWDEEGQKSHDNVVATPDAIVSGHTIAQWTENWWKWALQAPAGAGPLDSASHQSTNQGKIVFIAGSFDATIHAPAQTPILFPMINAYDTEGPGIETIQNFVADHRGSYADEARYITDLAQHSIYDAYAKLTKDAGTGHARTIFNVHLHGSEAPASDVKSGIFAIGAPKSGGYIENLLQSFGLLPLDPSIKNLPNTRSTGDWVEINGLKPGSYTLEFGGTGHAVVDKMTNTTIFAEGWGASVKDTLVVS
jgi:hypothetical protein